MSVSVGTAHYYLITSENVCQKLLLFIIPQMRVVLVDSRSCLPCNQLQWNYSIEKAYPKKDRLSDTLVF